MQIYEITRLLNENAFGAGFAQGAGISVPDIKDPSSALPGYGDARLKAAAAAAKSAIALVAKQEMQGWNTAVADLVKQKQVQNAAQLDGATKAALERDLSNRLHKVLMQGQLGNNYAQSLPANVDQVSRPAAKALVDRLNLATQSILDFENSTANATEQLKQWQNLSQTAYEAMALAQFYSDSRATMPELLNNPDGSYNIGNNPKGRLGSDPVDTAITQKIQAEIKANPGRMPELKSSDDGSISIGSQRLDPRDPNGAAAIKRIMSLMAKPTASPAPPPAPDTAGNTTSPGGIIIPAGARTAESTEKKRIAPANLAYKSKH